ncbi:hypothetical protein DS742_11005 [Lacrimispora amygdalina]|uniref:Uncharacterized protein n=1 Tax=Lacrimispora amygdalina TaxID=253257 RepID=A0A3E2NDB6_9FIRM|nr:hypothetical protein DS742_11005 [Clostridium indicum]
MSLSYAGKYRAASDSPAMLCACWRKISGFLAKAYVSIFLNFAILIVLKYLSYFILCIIAFPRDEKGSFFILFFSLFLSRMPYLTTN